MFDIGFPELLLLAIVALLVLGPERLPEVMRTLGQWIGQIRRYSTRIRMDLEREVGADDIRRELHNNNILNSIQEESAKLEADVNQLDPRQILKTPQKTNAKKESGTDKT